MWQQEFNKVKCKVQLDAFCPPSLVTDRAAKPASPMPRLWTGMLCGSQPHSGTPNNCLWFCDGRRNGQGPVWWNDCQGETDVRHCHCICLVLTRFCLLHIFWLLRGLCLRSDTWQVTRVSCLLYYKCPSSPWAMYYGSLPRPVMTLGVRWAGCLFFDSCKIWPWSHLSLGKCHWLALGPLLLRICNRGCKEVL